MLKQISEVVRTVYICDILNKEITENQIARRFRISAARIDDLHVSYEALTLLPDDFRNEIILKVLVMNRTSHQLAKCLRRLREGFWVVSEVFGLYDFKRRDYMANGYNKGDKFQSIEEVHEDLIKMRTSEDFHIFKDGRYVQTVKPYFVWKVATETLPEFSSPTAIVRGNDA